MNAHNEKQHQQPAAAQEAVGYVHGEPQFGNAGRKIGVLTSDVPVGTKLYAAPVTAAPAEPELDAHDPASGELAAQWLYGHGFKELAFVVRTQLDMRGARIRELSASTPAAPGIDLREIGGVMAEAEKHVETLHSLCPRASVFECIKRLRKAQAALIDASPKGDDVPLIDLVSDILTDLSNVAGSWVVEAAGASADAQNECASQMHDAIERWSNRLRLDDASPKGALPTLPDDFSESKDWRAGNYGERVEWLMDTVRSQREHIDSLLDSPKGGSEARDAARYRFLRDVAHPDSDDGIAVTIQKQDSWGKWRDIHLYGAELDAGIDAAMQEQDSDAEVRP